MISKVSKDLSEQIRDEEVGSAVGRWGIPAAGFEWVQAFRTQDGNVDLYLHPRTSEARGYPILRRPAVLTDFLTMAQELEEPTRPPYSESVSPTLVRGLHPNKRRFSVPHGDASLRAILRFANRHGWLGRPEAVYLPNPGGEIALGQPAVPAEPDDLWREEARTLLALDRTWRDLWAYESSSQAVMYRRRLEQRVHRAGRAHIVDWGSDGVVGVAVVQPFHLEANPSLERVVRAGLAITAVRQLRDSMAPTVVDLGGKGMSLRYQPKSLLAGLYFHFLNRLIGLTGHRRRACSYCGQEFVFTKADRLYCSTRCRKAASYYGLTRK